MKKFIALMLILVMGMVLCGVAVAERDNKPEEEVEPECGFSEEFYIALYQAAEGEEITNAEYREMYEIGYKHGYEEGKREGYEVGSGKEYSDLEWFLSNPN